MKIKDFDWLGTLFVGIAYVIVLTIMLIIELFHRIMIWITSNKAWKNTVPNWSMKISWW